MTDTLRRWRVVAAVLALALAMAAFFAPQLAMADASTGSISGTVADAATGAPIANVHVSVSSPSGDRSTTTNAQGFYAITSLVVDTYTVSFQAAGYNPESTAGVMIQQQQVITLNKQLNKELKTIAQVTSRSASNLVRPGQGSDVYTVTGQQFQAVTGNDNRPQTLYEYLGTLPGVTINGMVGTPRIRGGDVHDIGYEFDGIPIRERLFGIFTSNITNVGIGNIQVYTGGLPASDAGNGTGIINSVVKTGAYPAFGSLSFIATSPDHNNYVNFEYGGATPNRKLSYYIALGTTDSSNDYNYGAITAPDVLYSGFDGPGPVKERDWVGNFHYRPNDKNDFQFLIQNGIGDFIFNYLTANPQQKLGWAPCAGYTVDPTGNSYTGMIGGTAPNGATCPVGVFFSPVNGGGNIWHHYSGIGKIQWNHNINDHSYFSARLAENYNQYIFDQPLEDPNNPAFQNPGAPYNINPACPSYPYAAGSPVQIYGGNTANICSTDIQSFYGDRSSHMYIGALDYTNILSANLTINAGVGQEYDKNLLAYALRDYISGDGTWPDWYAFSDIPTHLPYAYLSANIKHNKWTFIPGVRWQRENYGIPAIAGGARSVGGFVPSISGTYQPGPNDVIRYSYGLTEDFIGSAYVYRSYPRAAGGAAPNNTYNPAVNGSSFNPEMNHDSELMWQHQVSPTTSWNIGPWYNSARGYYEQYNFLLGYTPTGTPIYSKKTYFTNSGQHHSFGIEAGLSHVDRRPIGVSYWLSATLDNYWTSEPSGPTSVSPLIRPIPSFFTSRGILVRSTDNPPFSASLTLDGRYNRWHMIPSLFYQVGTYYNIGTDKDANGVPFMLPTYKAGAWWMGNFSATYDLDANSKTVVGLRIRNLFDQEYGTTPCPNSSSGFGCFPFAASPSINGGNSNFYGPPGAYVWQPVTTDPRRFEFFITQKL